MPRKTQTEANAKDTKAERAPGYLSGGGVTREDSDDELGLEDHPWQWIYADVSQNDNRDIGAKKVFDAVDEIVGARMGAFECRLGDCVLLKAEGTNEAWIGIICDFEEDEEDGAKAANFMWFSTEKEIRNKQNKRMDAMQVRANFNGDNILLIQR